MKDVNHEIIIDTLLWYKIWQLSAYNPYPCKTKTSQKTQKSVMKFLEPTRKPQVVYTDNSLELGKSCEELSWKHCTSMPHRSETNGIAERAVRKLKEGTSSVLLQSAVGNEWWADSMECYCCLRNIQDLLSDEKTPYDRWFGMPFNGLEMQFGAMVENHPVSAKDQSRLHQFGPQSLARHIPRICIKFKRKVSQTDRLPDLRVLPGHWSQRFCRELCTLIYICSSK